MERERFSTTLKDLNRRLARLSPDDLGPLQVAFPAIFKEKGTRTLEGGGKVATVDVDLTPLMDASPAADLRGEFRALERAMGTEAVMRGDRWRDEGMHLALKEYLSALVPAADDAASGTKKTAKK